MSICRRKSTHHPMQLRLTWRLLTSQRTRRLVADSSMLAELIATTGYPCYTCLHSVNLSRRYIANMRTLGHHLCMLFRHFLSLIHIMQLCMVLHMFPSCSTAGSYPACCAIVPQPYPQTLGCNIMGSLHYQIIPGSNPLLIALHCMASCHAAWSTRSLVASKPRI